LKRFTNFVLRLKKQTMKNNIVTIRDVARKAGVSVGTVSHVLNGSPRHVGAATRERVLAAAQTLQYRPNVIARSMVKRATTTIGLVITELNNPLFVPVTEGVESVLREEGYGIVLASSHDIPSEMQAVETLRGRQVDGFIFMSLSVHNEVDHVNCLNEQGVPLVTINRSLDNPEINRVIIEDCGAGREATLHMLGLGHANVAIITGPRQSRASAVKRYEGWLEALQKRGIEPPGPDWIVDGDYTYEGGYQAVSQLLKAAQRPTAIFVCNESMAVGALKGLYDAGVNVPHDVALITVGDPPFAAYTTPALTTMALPVEEAGRIAAHLLVDWLKFGRPEPAREIMLSCELKIRESCGAYLQNRAFKPGLKIT
jgi:LacI family transcriptional regulator